MSTPSLLTITLQNETLNGFANNTNGSTVNIGKTIETQTIILRGYRVEMDTAAHALAQRYVYLDLPFLGGYCLTDGITYMSRLPLLLDNAIVTLKTEMTTPVRLSGMIPSQFTCACYDRDGTLVDPSQVLSVTVQFSYGTSSITGGS